MVLVVKNPLADTGDLRDMGSFPPWEDSMEEGMATHSNILVWRIPWTSLVGYSPWGHKESDMTARTHTLYICSLRRERISMWGLRPKSVWPTEPHSPGGIHSTSSKAGASQFPFLSYFFTYLWSSCLDLLPMKWSSKLKLNSHMEILGCPKEILWQEETTLPLITKETVAMAQAHLTAQSQTAACAPFEKVQSPHDTSVSFSRATLKVTSRSALLALRIYFVKCTVSPCIFSLLPFYSRGDQKLTHFYCKNKTQF